MRNAISSNDEAPRFRNERRPSMSPTGLLLGSPMGLRASEPFRDLTSAGTRAGPPGDFSRASASHTANTLLNHPCAACGPLWPFSRVHTWLVPGHRVAHSVAVHPRDRGMSPYRLMASGWSFAVSLIVSPFHRSSPTGAR